MTRTCAIAVREASAADATGIRALSGLSGSTLRSLDRDLARIGSGEPMAPVVLVAVEEPAPASRPEPATRVAPASRPAPATEQPAIVGAAIGLLQYDEGHVLDLAVTPARRRTGIASALLEALDVALRGRGAVALTLEVREGNLAAQSLYRRHGFTVEGRRPGYYPDGEDALLMWYRAAVDHEGS